MGCAPSTHELQPTKEEVLRDTLINKQLDAEKKLIEKEKLVKLLVLGSGESGKSTVIKQMTLIYGSGFTPEQIQTFRDAMHMNCFSGISALIEAMNALKIPYGFQKPTSMEETVRRLAETQVASDQFSDSLYPNDDDSDDDSLLLLERRPSKRLPKSINGSQSSKLVLEEGKCQKMDDPIARLAVQEYISFGGKEQQHGAAVDSAKIISSIDVLKFMEQSLSRKIETADAIQALWKDQGVQYCVSRANEYQLVDSCLYVMEHMSRIFDAGFQPTNDDILNARIMTTGVHEYKFKVGKISLAIYDVGGQRSERKKWAQYFDDTQLIIYLVAISAYDQLCVEDEQTNRIVESLNLFSSICNHPLFKKTDIVLFLNKIDLFQDKIKKRPIAMYFPDYDGPNDFQESSKYFAKRFKDINKYPNDKQIYPHMTHATDTNQTKKILKSVFESIQQSTLKGLNLE